MFASIADRYDLTNDVLSFGLHRYWEKLAIKQLTSSSDVRCLDLCTGTGALIPYLLKKFNRITAADFCQEMLDVAQTSFAKQVDAGELTLEWGDALDLKYADDSFDVITIAYGVRNFENLEQGLSEVRRVLKPGGELLILEFGQAKGIIAPFYQFYCKHIMPLLGALLTGNKSAYQYLPETAGAFPCGQDFIKSLGWQPSNARVTKLMGGIAYIYLVS